MFHVKHFHQTCTNEITCGIRILFFTQDTFAHSNHDSMAVVPYCPFANHLQGKSRLVGGNLAAALRIVLFQYAGHKKHDSGSDGQNPVGVNVGQCGSLRLD
jgi:hypothetical protein